MRSLTLLALTTILASGLPSQETYWVANRASNDIMELSPWGSVLQRVDLGTSLRSAHVAPDGKVWVVRFIQSTVDIYDPVAQTLGSVTCSLGSAYDIAFDDQGTAWVSGGTGVQNFDATGVSIQTYPLSAAAPLGITIDSAGNKWIAHRTSPGSVSRIDPAGAVTNYPVTGGNPVRPTADFRGLFNPNHIWVTCDNGGSLLELDENGTELGNFPMPATQIGGVGPVFDLNGDIWVGNYSTGSLYQFDPVASTLRNTYGLPGGVNGLSVDSLGRLLATARITFSGVGPPCEVRRVDPATGTLEMNTLLEYQGNNAAGTQSAASTPLAYSLVVAPLGDRDGDGDANYGEVLNGTLSGDPCSNATLSLTSGGVTDSTTGGTATLDVFTDPTTFWITAFAFGLVPAGSGYTLPGVACEVRLDPLSFLGSASGIGPATLSIPIPAVPSLVGIEFITQTVGITASSAVHVSNLSGFKIW